VPARRIGAPRERDDSYGWWWLWEGWRNSFFALWVYRPSFGHDPVWQASARVAAEDVETSKLDNVVRNVFVQRSSWSAADLSPHKYRCADYVSALLSPSNPLQDPLQEPATVDQREPIRMNGFTRTWMKSAYAPAPRAEQIMRRDCTRVYITYTWSAEMIIWPVVAVTIRQFIHDRTPLHFFRCTRSFSIRFRWWFDRFALSRVFFVFLISSRAYGFRRKLRLTYAQ
jgi:hypothetical protein